MADHYSHLNRSRFPGVMPSVPALGSGMNPFPLLQNQQLLNQMLLHQSIPRSHPNPTPASQTTPSSKMIKSPETSPGSDSGISNPGNPSRAGPKRVRAGSPLDLSARKSPETVSETAKSDFERLAGKISLDLVLRKLQMENRSLIYLSPTT